MRFNEKNFQLWIATCTRKEIIYKNTVFLSCQKKKKWMKWRLFHEFRRDNILERSFLFPCEGHILKLKPPPTLKGITHALSTQSMSDCCKSNIKIIKYIALVFFVNFIKMLDSSRGKKCSVWNNWMLLNDFNKFNKAKG